MSQGRGGFADTRSLTPAPGHRLVADHLEGSGPPWLYLHGLGSVRRGEKSEALFARARRLGRAAWRFDFRGHGESSCRLADVTLSMLCADARCVLEASGPAILVGSSLGGLVAAWIAATSREHVRGLCLIAPALGFLDRHSQQGGRTVEVGEAARADARLYDERLLPSAITVPTLVLHGEKDDTVPVRTSVELFEKLAAPRKRLWIVPGGDHRLNTHIDAILDLLVAELG